MMTIFMIFIQIIREDLNPLYSHIVISRLVVKVTRITQQYGYELDLGGRHC